MTRRNLLLLGAAGVASVGAAVWLTPAGPQREAPGGRGTLAFPGLAEKLPEAARIEIHKNGGALTLLRQGQAWIMPEKAGYPAKPERVREILVALTELRLTEQRTADPAQLDRLGLNDPQAAGSTAILLRVLDGANAPIAELVVGRRRVRTQGNLPEDVYVRRPNQTQAWLAEGRLAVDADPQLWLEREIVNLPLERVREVQVERVNEPKLVLAKAPEPEARMRITDPANPPSTDEVALDEVGRAFEFLTFLDVRPAAQIPGAALGQTRYQFTDNLAVTVWPSKEAENLWVRLEAAGDAEAERLNARWRGWAYQVGVWKEKSFVPRLDDLMAREPPAAPPAAPPTAPPTPPPAPR